MNRFARVLSVVIVWAPLASPASAAVEREWVLAASPSFKVLSDAGEKAARQAVTELEQIRAVFEQVLGVTVDVGRPVTVVGARDEDTGRRLLPEYWERKDGRRIGGVFMATDEKYWALVLMDTADATHAIRHEYVHLLIASRFGAAPLWLNEGLAEIYGSSRLSGDDVEVGRIDNHLIYLRGRSLLPVDKLVAVDHGSPEYEEEGKVSVFYAQSAVLAHYLLIADGGKHRPRLAEYLRLLAEDDMDDHAALERAFGGARKLDGELQGYVHRVRYSSVTRRIPVAEGHVKAVAVRPAQANAILADFLLDTGRTAGARRFVERAVELEPGLADARLQHARLLAREGQAEKASSTFAEVLRVMPSSVLAHHHFGSASGLPAGDDKAREASLRKATSLAPGYAPAQVALSRLLLDDGRAEEARTAALAAAAADPSSVRPLLVLLQAASTLGRADEVARVERALLQLVRVNPRVPATLVAHYESRGAPGEAEALLKRLRRQSPRNLRVVDLHADYLERHGRREEAEAVLREGLAIERKTATLLNRLAYLNAERDVKLPEAQKLADEALKLEPGSAAILDTKGWVLFRLGRLAEAEDHVRRSLAAEEHPTVREHLGDILEKAGRRPEAVECWRQALDAPGVEEKQKAVLAAKIEKAEPPADGERK